MITFECGLKAHNELGLAKELGLDVIVCDHHTPDDEMPTAVAVLDQKRPDCEYPDKNLCGCGVGFKLIQAVCKELNLDDDYPFQFLDLVSVAIGADIVPLVDENRIFSRFHSFHVSDLRSWNKKKKNNHEDKLALPRVSGFRIALVVVAAIC